MRFVDPVFSTGMEIGVYSALHGFEAIHAVLHGGDEDVALEEYERRVGRGVDAWYELIRLFYDLQNLFTAFAVNRRYRERVVRVLQGNLYNEDALARAKEIIDAMEHARDRVLTNPRSLLHPGALSARSASR